MGIRLGGMQVRIQKARRFQRENDRAFQRIGRRGIVGEKGINKHLALRLRQGPAKGGSHESGGKGAHLVPALRIVFARASQSIHVVYHTCRRF